MFFFHDDYDQYEEYEEYEEYEKYSLLFDLSLQLTPWTNWTSCGGYEGAEPTTLCGGGTKRRTTSVVLQPMVAYGGKACPALEQVKQCT